MVRGFKVGLTNRVTQLQVGLNEPDYGHLFDDYFFSDGSRLEFDAYCQVGAEPEIAFVLAKPLHGPYVNLVDVLDATAYVLPALEIVDSRVLRNTKHRFTIVDTVADNGGAAGVVLGAERTDLRNNVLTDLGVVFRRNGKIVDTGSTGGVLGHPAIAVVWLANKLSEFGVGLKAGDIVLSGSCTRSCALFKRGISLLPSSMVWALFLFVSSRGVGMTDVATSATLWRRAGETRVQLEAGEFRDLTTADAYAVQDVLVGSEQSAAAQIHKVQIVGRSLFRQGIFGEAVFGRLSPHAVLPAEGPVSFDALIACCPAGLRLQVR